MNKSSDEAFQFLTPDELRGVREILASTTLADWFMLEMVANAKEPDSFQARLTSRDLHGWG